jgi:hypothetical protein
VPEPTSAKNHRTRVLGWQIAGEDGDGIVTVLPPHLLHATGPIPPAERWPALMFQPVPEGHQPQNRLYIALAPPKRR